MLKRILVEQLRLGMYINELGGSWMDNPFWRNAFLLDDPKDLATLLSTHIKDVWIDTSKGIDIEADEFASGETIEEVAEEVETTLALADTPIKATVRASIAQEAALAVKICAKSKDAVASMFQESRMGHALNADEALPIVEEISNSVLRNPGALISLARLKKRRLHLYAFGSCMGTYCIASPATWDG